MSNKQPISTFRGIAAAVVLAANSSATVINVGPGDSIQAAISGASDGDEIILAPGTYNETINFLGKAIWLHSSDRAEVTITDAQQQGSVVPAVRCNGGRKVRNQGETRC